MRQWEVYASANLSCNPFMLKELRDATWSLLNTTYYVLSCTLVTTEILYHLCRVRAAVTSGNYVMFFRLFKTAPNLNTCLMDLYVEKMRFKAVCCISRSYRPTLHVSYIAQVLGFSSGASDNDEKDSDGLEECIEWLKAHDTSPIADNNGEMQLNAEGWEWRRQRTAVSRVQQGAGNGVRHVECKAEYGKGLGVALIMRSASR
ncbi:SAC3 family protein A-like isoform X3 [Humulus lupulus]|uniref:SAC3 family protein A-like isoform X3 n=1 Tax=Humulus lupulus TaxID=3486 RepID=UPI002B4158DC|nr:SAC3 family protein A-like isoform X3 [Humulus lupulus]XP_062086001.1 SAC3 family protein A-like isoform X3 [Humulus lupulus]XP_062086002.1 SAC3 family protein A-like isoform X3 [Humulus lupulus]XP_062086003.1 SAC3 family protein A-like isoform X3 [Humulus lupulus]XP_062086004.1 SAC3 family protein A-like isoform X3 [Humulus lupulus]XP_062086005.1 SAC3 family protein A-like isoform X3 [Humulus lupulus]XP_062086006.1 SAC3 family protein A-like isoform X3 [Humulus lupulus]XP_062086007.1 SAC